MIPIHNQQLIFLSLQSVFYSRYNSFIKKIIVFSLNKMIKNYNHNNNCNNKV